MDVEVELFYVINSCSTTLNTNIKERAAGSIVLIGGTLRIFDLFLIYNNQDEDRWFTFDLEYPDNGFYRVTDKDYDLGLHRVILKLLKDKYRNAIGNDEWYKIHKQHGEMYKNRLEDILQRS